MMCVMDVMMRDERDERCDRDDVSPWGENSKSRSGF